MRISPSNVPVSCIAVACVVLALASCATSHGPYDYAAEPDPRKHDFVVGPSDVLRVNVWHNPDLSADPVVRPDGNITLPLLGDIEAAGHTPAEIRKVIEGRLKTFVKDDAAIVTLAVATVNSYRFTVSGNVEKPGSYSSTKYVRVSEAVALAGGPNRFASPEKMILQRWESKGAGTRRIPIDYPRILTGERIQEDLTILAGDSIYVP